MNRIFVFGSNQSGIHGAGAARCAHIEHNARWGIGEGHTGNAYALPTKDYNIRTRPLADIKQSVDKFIEYARKRPDLTFDVTDVGCGLAGYSAEDIAPFFKDAPDNCNFLGRIGELR